MFNYPVLLTKDEDEILVTFPDVPEAITCGADEKEALKMAVDALETALSFYVEEQRPLPIPSIRDDLPTVRPSTLESIKLAIYSEMLAQNIRTNELANRLGWKVPQVNKLLDLYQTSKLEQLEQAAKALGKSIDVSLA